MDYPSDPEVGLVGGKFTDGDPVGGVPASLDRATEMNAVYDELLAVIGLGGAAPDEAVLTQVRDALLATFARADFATTHKLKLVDGMLAAEEL